MAKKRVTDVLRGSLNLLEIEDESVWQDNVDADFDEGLIEAIFGEAERPRPFGTVGSGRYAIVFEERGRRYIETSKLMLGVEDAKEFYEWLDNAICYLLDEDEE